MTLKVAQVPELGRALARGMFRSAGRADVGHEARQNMPQARRREFVIFSLGISRRERERLLPRASGTVRNVGRLVRELVRNGAQGFELAYQVVRIQVETI